MKRDITLSYQEIKDFNSLSRIEQNLLSKASLSLKSAYAPYSKFLVGASVLLSNNKIISGNNQENASFPCGICAERVALFSAKSNYPNVSVKKIAITATSTNFNLSEPAGPCGLCRQVLLEYEEMQKLDIQIFLFNKNKIIKIAKAKDLLPFFFMENRLIKK